MAVLERRRAAKWHKQVTATVREVSPSEGVSDGRFALFPYAQVHAFTKAYLGKRKRSQIETDRVLIDLINAHPRKEVAFASCADALSELVVEGILNSIFDVDPTSLEGLEAYLQAFVAAAYSKEGLFLESDRTFASSMIFVARDAMNQQITPITAKTLFTAWGNTAPFDRFLLSRVKLLTRHVCQRIANDLSQRESETWWALAKDYMKSVSLLRSASVDLEDCLHLSFPAWQAWANWTPDIARMQVWACKTPPNPLRYIRELDAPALRPGCHLHGSEWHTLIHRCELISWLESKGFVLGPDLIMDDREEHLIDVVQQLLDRTVDALKRGPAFSNLLLVLIDKLGLGQHSLDVWQRCTSTLDPDFVKILSTSRRKIDSDITLVQGLHSLDLDEAECIRSNLGSEIGHCVHHAAETTRARFLSRFSTRQHWDMDARRLWVLRDAIRKSGWLHEHIDQRLVNSSQSQASNLALTRLSDLQRGVQMATGFVKSEIETPVDAYVQNFVLDGVVTRNETTMMPQVLHTLCICSEREEVRKTGIVIAALTGLSVTERTLCIRRLLNISKELVDDLHDNLILLPNQKHSNFVSLTRTVTLITRALDSSSEPWGALLRWAMKEYCFDLHELAFTTLGFRIYTAWIAHLHEIFADSLMELDVTHTRLSELKPFERAIETLETRCQPRFALSNMLIEADVPSLECYCEVLQCLLDHSDSARLELLSTIILATEFGSSKAGSLRRTILDISELSDSNFSLCQDLFDLYRRDQSLACSRLRAWLRTSWLDTAAEEALRNLAAILDIDLSDDEGQAEASLELLHDYYASRVADMIQMAEKLEQSRSLLKKTEPDGLNSMIAGLELERPTAAAQMLVDLPSELLDITDEAADDVVELHFPLSPSTLTTTERLAFGLKGSETFLVHFRIDKIDQIDAFCVHMEDENTHNNPSEHEFFAMDSSNFPPDRSDCGGRSSRLTYIVARQLWRQLKTEENSLKELHAGIQQVIRRGASRCMVCTNDLDARLHRPTICKSTGCELVYQRSDPDVRLEDLRVDSPVVDLLLSSVFAAATTGNLELLPGRPPALGDGPELVGLLNSMSPTADLAMKNSDQTNCDKQTEALLSWLCNSYRGFVISATERYKIPNFPNVQQFLLVDGPPEIEAAFAQHNELTPRHLLFHGTSMDRLYSVLCQGLRVLSGTTLQKHGAVYGPGIYFAREPAFAMNFSSRTAVKGNATFFDSRSDFKNVTVLLGCEHAGNDDNASLPNGIHVVTDPSRVMVRYIWIVPHGTKVPRAQDIRIPMLSTFNDLRSTAVGKLE